MLYSNGMNLCSLFLRMSLLSYSLEEEIAEFHGGQHLLNNTKSSIHIASAFTFFCASINHHDWYFATLLPHTVASS